MKSNVTRWLPALAKKPNQMALLGVAGVTIFGAVAAGTAPQASAASETSAIVATSMVAAAPAGGPAKAPAVPAKASAKAAATTAKAPAKTYPAKKQLAHNMELQPNYFYCAPTTVRIALSAHGKAYSADQLAKSLGTTTNGTNSADDVTRVLNAKLGKGRYHSTFIRGQKATAAQVAQIKTDIVTTINQGDMVVANIAGAVTDDNGQVHSYPGGHYLPVWGYLDNGNTVKMADEADTVGSPYYTLSIQDLANWIATRGYSS